jgi:hypothetical protein
MSQFELSMELFKDKQIRGRNKIIASTFWIRAELFSSA